MRSQVRILPGASYRVLVPSARAVTIRKVSSHEFELRLEGHRARSARREPGLSQRVLKRILRPVMRAWRTTVDGLHLIPESGGVLVAPNHGSYLDHFFLAYRIDRPVHFMAAAELFSNPAVGRILSSLGAFPVRRGAHDAEAVATAEAILDRGGLVVIYPQGGIRPSLDAVPPRRGVGVLALSTGAPVVPAAIIDATALHRSGFLRLPKMTVRFGPSLAPERRALVTPDEAEAEATRIWDDVVRLHSTGH